MKEAMISLKAKFYESLENDNDKWIMSSHGAAGYNWYEFDSPDYGTISYKCDESCLYVNVFIGRYKECSFRVNIFKYTKVRKLIKKIKKRYEDKHYQEINKIVKKYIG